MELVFLCRTWTTLLYMKWKFEWVTPLYSTHFLPCIILAAFHSINNLCCSEEINIYHHRERFQVFWSEKNMRFGKFLMLRRLYISFFVSYFRLFVGSSLWGQEFSSTFHSLNNESPEALSALQAYSERIQTQSMFPRPFLVTLLSRGWFYIGWRWINTVSMDVISPVFFWVIKLCSEQNWTE